MLHLHSFLRYVVLILLIAAVVKSLMGWRKNKNFNAGDQQIGLFLMITAHVQLLLGLFLYMTQGWLGLSMADAMADPERRFWKVEHIAGMIIAIVLITIGRMRAKRVEGDLRKHKNSFIYYTIALILILGSIKWEMDRLI